MLSQPSPGHSPGRHQRQNSTSTAIGTPLTNGLTQQSASPISHQRGHSYDQTITPRNVRQLGLKARTPMGVEEIFGQQPQRQHLQETQQHMPQQARPGQNTTTELTNLQRSNHESRYLNTTCPEHGTTEQSLQAMLSNWDNTVFPSLENDNDANNVHSFPNPDTNMSAGYLEGFGHDFSNNNLAQENNVEDISEKITQAPCQHDLHSDSLRTAVQRPSTPVKQNVHNYFPMTPASTPFSNRGVRHTHTRTAESSPTRRDPQLTIKASQSMQRGSSYQGDFMASGSHPMSPVPSPPRTAPLRQKGTIDRAEFTADIFNMSKLQVDMSNDRRSNDNADFSPMSKPSSSIASSFQSSPEFAHMSLYEGFQIDANGTALSSRLSNLTETPTGLDFDGYPSPGKQSMHGRSNSASDLGELEECIEDTGISGDDIAAFISGPDADNKWTCLFESKENGVCNKKFGRKENVKSHVQTHLGDRQYRCKQCNKCFVRQHDLKRHANIHTNARLYKCPCGKEFARHDALTRHRQRNMCAGALDSSPKKVVKRGRPPKTKLDSPERRDKAAKTRQAVLERMMNNPNYPSSSSGSSVSSHPSPPEQFDNMNVGGPSPSPTHRTLPQEANAQLFTWTPSQSPILSAHTMSHEPSQQSHHSQEGCDTVSPLLFPDLPMTRQDSEHSTHSMYSAVPELDPSSSSPAAAKLMDFSSSDAGTGSSLTSSTQDELFSNDFFNRDFSLSQIMSSTNETSVDPNFDAFMDFAEPSEQGEDKPRSGTLRMADAILSPEQTYQDAAETLMNCF